MRNITAKMDFGRWTTEHDPENRTLFALRSRSGDAEITLVGAEIADLKERDALITKTRKHGTLDGVGHTVETESTIPFGIEPVISRKFEYYRGTARCTTDIALKSPLSMDSFEVDNLRLSRKWNRFAVVAQDADGALPNELSWREIPDGAESLAVADGSSDNPCESALWESDETPLCVLLEDSVGNRLEIGAGFDLWRWNVAGTFAGAEGRFSLAATSEGDLLFRRSVLNFAAETEVAAREWRFNWYLAWSDGAFEKAPLQSNEAFEKFPDPGDKPPKIMDGQKIMRLSLDETLWPEQARRRLSTKTADAPCLHSKAVRNHLRKTIRKIAAAAPNSCLEKVQLAGLLPGVCDVSAHLERPKAAKLAHWDLTDIIAFHFWARRQLADKGVEFELVAPTNGIYVEMPSLNNA